MAKQNCNSKDNKNGSNPKRSLFKDERIRFTIGLFTILLSFYITIAFVSYLFMWKADQSFQWQSIFSSSATRVDNWGGKVGASIAAQFLNKWFGISSFVVPFLVGIIGLRFLKIKLFHFKRTLFKSIIGMILLSLVLGFLFNTTGGYLGSGLGGAHGVFITDWMNAFIGKAGTAFLLFVLSIAFLIYLNENFLHWLKKIYFILLGSIKEMFSKNETKESDRNDQTNEIDEPLDLSNEKTALDDQEQFVVSTMGTDTTDKPIDFSDFDEEPIEQNEI